MDSTVFAYLAGFFDGEGCVSISTRKESSRRPRRYFKLRLQVSQTKNIEALMLFQRTFGGSVYQGAIRNPKHATPWWWEILNLAAWRALEQMRPYLINKRPHAELAAMLRKTVQPKNNIGKLGVRYTAMPDEVLEQREALATKMRLLNRKGAVA
jgi:hypothetical protein